MLMQISLTLVGPSVSTEALAAAIVNIYVHNWYKLSTAVHETFKYSTA